MNDDIILIVIKKHISQIAQWVNEELAERNAESDIDYLMSLLPRSLRRRHLDKDALLRAFEDGFFSVENGTLVPHFDSCLQLTYFCGRCFCRDYPESLIRTKYWRKGKKRFPARDLERLFDVRNLRELRKNHLEKRISESLQLIDYLFV